MNDILISRTKYKVNFAPYLYILPAFFLFSIFTFYPFIKTIYISTTITNITGKVMGYVGLDNYISALKSPAFINSLIVSFQYIPMIAIPPIFIGLALALIANYRVKGNRIYITMFALPIAVAAAPTAAIFQMLYHPTNGLFNYLLGKEIMWLTDPDYALAAVAVATVWTNMGRDFIFLYAGVRNIPKELMESASIDGACFFDKFFKIMLPMLSPQLFFVIITTVLHSFQSFAMINMLTNGGPGTSTTVVIFSIYREAFQNNRFDMACTQSMILFIIMFVATLIQFRFEKRSVFYQ